MVLSRNEQAYYEWLCGCVLRDPRSGGEPNEEMVLRQLYFIEFKVVVPNDSHRLEDGYRMRERFSDSTGLAVDWDAPVNVLEVLVSLAKLIAEDVIGDFYREGKAAQWFWMMIDNLFGNKWKPGGLLSDRVRRGYICGAVEAWLNRDFRPDGSGSPFPLKDPKDDQRGLELWQQVCAYLVEHPELER